MTAVVGVWPVRVEAEGLAERVANALQGELIRPWRQPSQANYRCTASDDPRSRATLHLVTRMLVLGLPADFPRGP